MLWRRKWQPTPVFLPGESHGQRSLVGCHLWGHTESDTIEKISWKKKWQLQYSYLGNPTDRGAWQATVHGVTKEPDMATKQKQQQIIIYSNGNKLWTNFGEVWDLPMQLPASFLSQTGDSRIYFNSSHCIAHMILLLLIFCTKESLPKSQCEYSLSCWHLYHLSITEAVWPRKYPLGNGPNIGSCCSVAIVFQLLSHVPLFSDTLDCSLPNSFVHGISQARILEWVAISFFRGSFWLRNWTWVASTGRQILHGWATRAASCCSKPHSNSALFFSL